MVLVERIFARFFGPVKTLGLFSLTFKAAFWIGLSVGPLYLLQIYDKSDIEVILALPTLIVPLEMLWRLRV